MSVQTQARQPVGVPIGGQFAVMQHAEPDVALGATALETLTAEDYTGQVHKENVASFYVAVLGLAGVKGHLHGLEVDGQDLRGQLTTPEGIELGFSTSRNSVDVWHENEDDLDPEHKGGSDVSRQASGEILAADQVGEAFDTARRHARIADAWARSTSLRSTPHTRFGLPALVTEDGRQVGAMDLTAGTDCYRVVVERGSNTPEVYNDAGTRLSPRMATALLMDASADATGNPDEGEVAHAIIMSLAVEKGGAW